MQNKGKVTEVKDGIIYAINLPEVGLNEKVKIYTDNFEELSGLVINLDSEVVSILALSDYLDIKEGNSVVATGELLSIKVNENMIGRTLDALGNPIDGGESIDDSKSQVMELDKIAPGVIERKDVDRPLQTGIVAVDAMIPIGRGQRQLIIGDRLTGKTAIAIDAIINQKDKDCICIYVAIGQKTSKTAQIIAKLEEQDALKNTIIINASASDPVAYQYLAPYTGTAIGEYFAEIGKDALVIYDDLSKHAQSYREISLLLKRPSGREAYPGDIFYLHSKLLERSVQFSDEKGGGSLTSLPIVETQAGDVSAYIPTNIISITDGQIYLEQDLFNAGQKPAISIGISVSRVGGAAQTKGLKQVSGQLKLDLAQYRELAAFAQFGSDLDKETSAKLERGSRIMEIMKQRQYSPFKVSQMIGLIYAANKGFLDGIAINDIAKWKEDFVKDLDQNTELSKKLDGSVKIENEIEESLVKFINEFNLKFEKLNK